VFNTGRPLDPSEQERLFQKFSRIEGEETKNVKGSGVGLYFVKEIIEGHGGKSGTSPSLMDQTLFLPFPKTNHLYFLISRSGAKNKVIEE
jgi:Signal transduction histidine kinase